MTRQILQDLRAAQSVVLTTHRHCDGDGLGAEIALALGLESLGKKVRMIHVDETAEKYAFLEATQRIEIFRPDGPQATFKTDDHFDLTVILDTNDSRLVEPLFSELKRRSKQVLFIDHHPLLDDAPPIHDHSIVDSSSASTGQLCFELLHELGAPLNRAIGRALYTSVAFDTQLFRYVKSDPRSHLMAAELLKHEIDPEDIHRRLFANYTVRKMKALLTTLSQTEYFDDDRAAFIPMRADLFTREGGFERDDSGDVVDQVMNIESVEIAALLREDGPGHFKLSLRSKGRLEVMSLASKFGGGGHKFASGAHLRGEYGPLRESIVQALLAQVASQKPMPK